MKSLKKRVSRRKGLEDICGKSLYSTMKDDISSIEDIIEDYIKNLGIGISNYINIFAPEAISIGGSFIYYQDILLPKLEEYLKQNNLIFYNEIPKITVAKHGNDAGMIGATLI